jgi:cation transport protein ChaC
VSAIAYVVNRRSRLYAGAILPAQAAAAIAVAAGEMGPNRDYLEHTRAHLTALGLGDAGLDRIASLLPAAASAGRAAA